MFAQSAVFPGTLLKEYQAAVFWMPGVKNRPTPFSFLPNMLTVRVRYSECLLKLF